jgi:hypothetical protein
MEHVILLRAFIKKISFISWFKLFLLKINKFCLCMEYWDKKFILKLFEYLF